MSHYTARGETLFFVDGKLAGAAPERLEPKSFALGGPGEADFKDLLIYRSALNADEVAALESGTSAAGEPRGLRAARRGDVSVRQRRSRISRRA